MKEIKDAILSVRTQAQTANNLAKEKFDALFDQGSRNSLAYALIAETGDLCCEIVEKCDRILICMEMAEEVIMEETAQNKNR